LRLDIPLQSLKNAFGVYIKGIFKLSMAVSLVTEHLGLNGFEF